MKLKDLNILFTPAVYIMSKLRYSKKFLLISVLFLIPIFIGLYLFLSQVNYEIQNARNEQLGLETLRPIKDLLQDMQQYRGMMSAKISGSIELDGEVVQKRQEIEKDFLDIEENNKKIILIDRKDPLKLNAITLEIDNIKVQWEYYKKLVDKGELNNTQESYTKLTNINHNILAVISHVGDASGLVLDSYLDTYYLSDATTEKLPVISEYLGEARAWGFMVPKGKSLSQSDKQVFLSALSVANSNLLSLDRGMQIVFMENSDAKKVLLSEYEKTVQQSANFLGLINTEIINKHTSDINEQEYHRTTTLAINQVFDFYESSSIVLHNLLEKRIDVLKEKRTTIGIIVFGVLFFVVYLFFGFYIGLKNVVEVLRDTTEAMIEGKKTSDKVFESEDELKEVVVFFNRIANALTSSNGELKDALEKQRKAELSLHNHTKELERFNKHMVGREFKMVELKKEIESLKKEVTRLQSDNKA